MDSGELLERINTLIEGQKIARGDMLYRGHADAELVEAAARIRQCQARIEALEEGLRTFQSYGCPVCNGDCGSANPPVSSCPMRDASALLQGGGPS